MDPNAMDFVTQSSPSDQSSASLPDLDQQQPQQQLRHQNHNQHQAQSRCPHMRAMSEQAQQQVMHSPSRSGSNSYYDPVHASALSNFFPPGYNPIHQHPNHHPGWPYPQFPRSSAHIYHQPFVMPVASPNVPQAGSGNQPHYPPIHGQEVQYGTNPYIYNGPFIPPRQQIPSLHRIGGTAPTQHQSSGTTSMHHQSGFAASPIAPTGESQATTRTLPSLHPIPPPVRPTESGSNSPSGRPRVSTSSSESSTDEEADLNDQDASLRHALDFANRIPPAFSGSEENVRQQQLFRGALSAKRVASRSALASLQSVNISDLFEEERTCCICYNDFGTESPEGINEAPLRLPKCKHIFGDHCIKTWFNENDTCPYCRDRVHSEPQFRHRGSHAVVSFMRQQQLHNMNVHAMNVQAAHAFAQRSQTSSLSDFYDGSMPSYRREIGSGVRSAWQTSHDRRSPPGRRRHGSGSRPSLRSNSYAQTATIGQQYFNLPDLVPSDRDRPPYTIGAIGNPREQYPNPLHVGSDHHVRTNSNWSQP